jgi:small subunit ribosomal protein S20
MWGGVWIPVFSMVFPSGLPCRKLGQTGQLTKRLPKELVFMAHHRSAKKRIRQTETRTEVNGARRSRIRSFIRSVEEAIASGNAPAAKDALKQLQPEIDRGVSKGVMHANTAARKLSRLTARARKLAA